MTKPNITFEQYLDQVFIPQKTMAGHLNPRAATHYRFCVRVFMRVMGVGIKLRDITDLTLETFQVEALAAGYSRQTAESMKSNVRIILRYWNPKRFPDMRGGASNGTPVFAERDIEGTLEQIFCDHFLPERTSISSPGTVRQYGHSLGLFTRFLGFTAKPEDLTDRVVGGFLRWLVQVEGVKPVTANAYVKQIKSLWVWLAKKRVVDQFPTVQKLKQPDPTPVAWTREEWQKLYAGCRNQVGFAGPVLANLFWSAFYLVLWDSGERTGAMLSLRWEWLDMKSGHLTVPGEFRKGRTQSMVYRLKPQTLVALKALEKPTRELIFDLTGKKDPRAYFYRRHCALVKSSGLPYVKHKSGPQKGRRTFASFIEASGGNATKALKHRDRRVTEDSYLDPRITDVKSENENLFPLYGSEAT